MPSDRSVDVQCPFQGCPIRLSVKTNRYSNLRRHITETKRHSKEPLPITCIQPGCNQIVAAFPDFDTFMFEHYLYEHYRLRINHRPRRSKKDQPARDNPLDNDGNSVEDVAINEQQTADNRYVNGGGFDHGVHNADGEPEDEYTPPWNANEPENGYAVDDLNGEVDQTDALGLFDDPINDAQWNTVEEYVAAAAAENELATVDELEYGNEEMNESVGTERTAGMNGITYDYSRMVIQEADRKLLDFMKVVMKNRVTRQFYTELMETLLFREWKESGQAANFPENIRTSKRRCMQMFSGLIKIQYPKLHDEATPYVSLISVVKFWNRHPRLSEVLYEVNVKHTLPEIGIALQCTESAIEDLFNRRQRTNGASPMWEGSFWFKVLARTKHLWQPAYDAFRTQNLEVIFVHIIPFSDGFRTAKRRLNNMNVITVTAGEFDHAIRSKSTSHGICIINLMSGRAKDQVTTDPIASMMQQDFDQLIRGVVVWNEYRQNYVGVIGVFHVLLGDTPGRQNFSGFKEGNLLTTLPCILCYVHRDQVVESVSNPEIEFGAKLWIEPILNLKMFEDNLKKYSNKLGDMGKLMATIKCGLSNFNTDDHLNAFDRSNALKKGHTAYLYVMVRFNLCDLDMGDFSMGLWKACVQILALYLGQCDGEIVEKMEQWMQELATVDGSQYFNIEFVRSRPTDKASEFLKKLFGMPKPKKQTMENMVWRLFRRAVEALCSMTEFSDPISTTEWDYDLMRKLFNKVPTQARITISTTPSVTINLILFASTFLNYTPPQDQKLRAIHHSAFFILSRTLQQIYAKGIPNAPYAASADCYDHRPIRQKSAAGDWLLKMMSGWCKHWWMEDANHLLPSRLSLCTHGKGDQK